MAGGGQFDDSVFINCPFDPEFRPILEAILFCVLDCGLQPRLSSERLDSGEVRLSKIVELMKECRYSIHDLSRVQATKKGEHARLNMPFELGVDYGLALAGTPPLSSKQLLVIAEQRYEYQVALSDIAGWDIRAHDDDFEQAIKEVRHWLAANNLTTSSASRIVGRYLGYQEWDYERLLDAGWSDDDIQERQTPELLQAMRDWVDAGRPLSHP
ncbi:hypothetical protein JQN72_03715 [Phycicoccus sp. CSK15P-2]|uniref:hypothetical protein n=1 Tax=Phycicoccus sp. CSK15P-2 TaxID=2807627 RepID=UPI00194F2B67|nr:hypothetical protein [Phycicoccus sp. CSK15P-2]MBM6403348.1 hypothetical protein [Phycicoccus sp. CSK15P-2]